MIVPNKRTPCNQCPFRKDTFKGWLGEERMTEILNSESFVCHKTVHVDDKDRLQCAGHMILLREDNEFYRWAKFLNCLDLKGYELVFEKKEDCINHHKF